MSSVETHGNSPINFYIKGKGRPLVLIHPLGLDHRLWDYCIGDLAEHRTLITFDLPGHGLSPVPDNNYSIEDISKNLLESLRLADIDKADFLGLSIGGMILQHFASVNASMVEKLILVDTTFKYSKDWQLNWTERARISREEGLENMLEKLLEAFFTEDYLRKGSEDIDYCRDVISKMSGEGYALACEALSRCNLEKSASAITSQTLILCGDQDNDLFKDATLWLSQNIPHSQYEWLAPAQHLSPLERRVDFLKIVRKFLEI
ncbi:MAG: alpha/beta fold hydrolase [Gammaproteobacteria bacterium]|jgi:pimeloyl-ACP methyl ester carboxylesterase|nr:alpha/beta fold hydrolase [Gammaproteobacteria bacterium]|tara:strand:- start:525 stop:1310 length:786 start_codon:yes stop_codon:yes gene_type:complete